MGHSYSTMFHQVEFRCMPLKSDTVEAASRTLLLLEELNRHRVTSIDRLHKAIVAVGAAGVTLASLALERACRADGGRPRP